MVNGPDDAKLATLADPAWRDRARTEWDHRTRSSLSRVDRPDEMILAISETGAGPLDISLAEYAAQRGLHISDALAEWVLANGIRSIMVGTPERLDEDDVVAALREPRTVSPTSTTAARTCSCSRVPARTSTCSRTTSATRPAQRSRRRSTCSPGARRGSSGCTTAASIAPGKAGDLAVFALDEIELQREERRYDVPHGTWRFTRPPAGFRATVVAGTPTWLDGADTGERPGGFIRPG